MEFARDWFTGIIQGTGINWITFENDIGRTQWTWLLPEGFSIEELILIYELKHNISKYKSCLSSNIQFVVYFQQLLSIYLSLSSLRISGHKMQLCKKMGHAEQIGFWADIQIRSGTSIKHYSTHSHTHSQMAHF